MQAGGGRRQTPQLLGPVGLIHVAIKRSGTSLATSLLNIGRQRHIAKIKEVALTNGLIGLVLVMLVLYCTDLPANHKKIV